MGVLGCCEHPLANRSKLQLIAANCIDGPGSCFEVLLKCVRMLIRSYKASVSVSMSFVSKT